MKDIQESISLEFEIFKEEAEIYIHTGHMYKGEIICVVYAVLTIHNVEVQRLL